MRTIIYGIFDTETNKRIYTNVSYAHCLMVMNELYGDNLEIRHIWKSF